MLCSNLLVDSKSNGSIVTSADDQQDILTSSILNSRMLLLLFRWMSLTCTCPETNCRKGGHRCLINRQEGGKSRGGSLREPHKHDMRLQQRGKNQPTNERGGCGTLRSKTHLRQHVRPSHNKRYEGQASREKRAFRAARGHISTTSST